MVSQLRAHYLQHVAFEGLGSIEAWLHSRGYEITSTQFYQSTELPKIDEIDFLIIMGGPMSVNDENEHPWLALEKDFIHKVILAGKPVLGICLGAQLIASALGSNISANADKEIGWFEVQSVISSDPNHYRFPNKTIAFHWHGETFSLPQQVTLIAKSEGCKHQAFQVGSNVIGLQFHLETTPSSAKALIDHCRAELVPGRYIQTVDEILDVSENQYTRLNKLMENLLDYLHSHRDI